MTAVQRPLVQPSALNPASRLLIAHGIGQQTNRTLFVANVKLPFSEEKVMIDEVSNFDAARLIIHLGCPGNDRSLATIYGAGERHQFARINDNMIALLDFAHGRSDSSMTFDQPC